jgi:hypothetical protein
MTIVPDDKTAVGDAEEAGPASFAVVDGVEKLAVDEELDDAIGLVLLIEAVENFHWVWHEASSVV